VMCDDSHVRTDAPCPQDIEFDRVRGREGGGRAVLLFYERVDRASGGGGATRTPSPMRTRDV
jgi:hypothetical protein